MPSKPVSLNQFPHSERVIRVLQAALQAADPRKAIQKHLDIHGEIMVAGGVDYPVKKYSHVFLIAIGKASIAMAQGVVDRVGDYLSGGVVVTKSLPARPVEGLERFEIILGEHPVPGRGSLTAGKRVFELLQGAGENDLVICAISGGGSALFTWPVEEVSLSDLQALTSALLGCGASIQEINTLRKHLDRVKGGGMAKAAAPARLLNLILSDVVGNPLDAIASGPAVPDSSTFQDAIEVLHRYELWDKTAVSIQTHLLNGKKGLTSETLKPGDAAFDRVQNLVVGSNLQAAMAAEESARTQGFNPYLITTDLQGEAREAGILLSNYAHKVHENGVPVEPPACLIAGGETTVTLHGNGLGGRNQELALSTVKRLSGLANTLLITLATDGEDGPTQAAGAVVSGNTNQRARAAGMDPEEYLARNDAFHFFEQLDDLLITGSTGTNVNDLTFLFIESTE